MSDSFFLTDMIGIPVTDEFKEAALKRKAESLQEVARVYEYGGITPEEMQQAAQKILEPLTNIFLGDVEYTDPRVTAQGNEISDTKLEQK